MPPGANPPACAGRVFGLQCRAMTRRERLRRCYWHQELDRPAVYSRTGFPADDPTYDELKAYLKAHTELRSGWSPTIESSYPWEHRTEPHSEDWERRISTLRTSAGDLESSCLVSRKGQPGLTQTHLLKGPEDAEKYRSLPMPELAGDVSSYFEAEREIGDRGIVEISLGLNPGGFVAELFGSESFAMMSITNRDLLHALCERQMTVIMDRVKYLLRRGVGECFCSAGEEYITPPLHGPRDFNEFNVKYNKPIFDLIHEAGGRVYVHCHGSIKKVFQGFVEMGTDVLHPFEAPPMGDITPAEAKALARGKLTLEGNIQIGAMYEHTPEQIRAETQALIKTAFDDGRGLIVCPTASPYIWGAGEKCFPQYKAMIDTVLEWKG